MVFYFSASEPQHMKTNARAAGILLPVSSLPSRYGIGGTGSRARAFIDFLAAAGQTYWQVLPLSATSFGDSPYQSPSAFAGNPYFIDPETLQKSGLVTEEELAHFLVPHTAGGIDYGELYRSRPRLLHIAFSRFDRSNAQFVRFCREQRHWLDDYALFAAVKDKLGGVPLCDFPDSIRLRDEKTLASLREELSEETEYRRFCQYMFSSQWAKLREYAALRGIKIIGDMPLYVAADSADFWAHREQFLTDGEGRPRFVAGVPPDYFSADGQRWGNPLYDWEKMREDGYSWWRARISACAGLFDALRIDHFIGIARYYAIPADSEGAKNGSYREGPGFELVRATDEAAGKCFIIAEDLGAPCREAEMLLKRAGYPGMHVLLFGGDGNPSNPHLPHNFDENCVVYVDTHDNDTAAGFCRSLTPEQLAPLMNYYGAQTPEQLPELLLDALYESRSDTAISTMQDWLGLGNEARMNTPGLLGHGNWCWEMEDGMLTSDLAGRIYKLTERTGRLPRSSDE